MIMVHIRIILISLSPMLSANFQIKLNRKFQKKIFEIFMFLFFTEGKDKIFQEKSRGVPAGFKPAVGFMEGFQSGNQSREGKIRRCFQCIEKNKGVGFR